MALVEEQRESGLIVLRTAPEQAEVVDESDALWRVDETKTEPHWLVINDGEGWWSAVVKRDGCVDLNRYFNAPWGRCDSDRDYIHLCDIDDAIERLQALKAVAKRHFGDDWGE